MKMDVTVAPPGNGGGPWFIFIKKIYKYIYCTHGTVALTGLLIGAHKIEAIETGQPENPLHQMAACVVKLCACRQWMAAKSSLFPSPAK